MRERLDVLGYTTSRANAELNRYCAQDETIERSQFDAWTAAMVAPVDENEEWPDQPQEPRTWLDVRWIVRLLLVPETDFPASHKTTCASKPGDTRALESASPSAAASAKPLSATASTAVSRG